MLTNSERSARFECGIEASSKGDLPLCHPRGVAVYYLVLLRPGEASSDARLNAEHEAFIDDLIRRNQILLGGNLLPREDLPAAYLLVCDSLEQAELLVLEDPYVRDTVFRPRILEWQLVAINPEAVRPELVVRPTDLE